MSEKEIQRYKVAIIGLGPGGIGAALKLHEQKIPFVIFEKSTPGGKVNVAPRVDNYPGFKMISGPDLAMKLYQRIIDAQIKVTFKEVVSLTKTDEMFTLLTQDGQVYEADFVIIGSGTKEKKIGLDKEEELLGKGISYCSICDGHFYKDLPVAVVGGGNAALKEAIHLSEIVSHLYLIHRRNEFRGQTNFVNELKAKKNVEILTPYVPVEIEGDNFVQGLKIQNRETGEIKDLKIDGLFPLVGQDPNTSFVEIDGVLDEYKTIPVNLKTMETNCHNLFAIGDCLPRLIRQIYLAEHDGMIAANTITSRMK